MDIKQGDRVRVPKGTVITRTTHPHPRSVVGRTTVVTVTHTFEGYTDHYTGEEVPDGISWAGSGGYWVDVKASDVEVVI